MPLDSKVNPAAEVSGTAGGAQPQSLEQRAPLALSIEKALHTSGMLHVFGSVEAMAPFPSEDVAITLTGYDGYSPDKLRESGGRLRQLEVLDQSGSRAEMPAWIMPGSPVRFHVSTDASGMSEYQLGLLWGAEADIFPKDQANVPVPVSAALRDVEMQLQDCAGTDCVGDRYIVTGTIVNNSSQTLHTVTVGVGYFAAGGGSSSTSTPQNEQTVVLDKLQLAAQAHKRIRVIFDLPPYEKAEKLKPSLRIISAS